MQFLGVEWLGEEVVGARMNARDAMLPRAVAGYEDDGDQSSLWRLFNPAADLKAADARQVHVEQNQIRLLPLDHRDRALTAARRFDVVALDGQQANDQPQVGVVVFDDKNRGVGVFQRAGISGSNGVRKRLIGKAGPARYGSLRATGVQPCNSVAGISRVRVGCDALKLRCKLHWNG